MYIVQYVNDIVNLNTDDDSSLFTVSQSQLTLPAPQVLRWSLWRDPGDLGIEMGWAREIQSLCLQTLFASHYLRPPCIWRPKPMFCQTASRHLSNFWQGSSHPSLFCRTSHGWLSSLDHLSLSWQPSCPGLLCLCWGPHWSHPFQSNFNNLATNLLVCLPKRHNFILSTRSEAH